MDKLSKIRESVYFDPVTYAKCVILARDFPQYFTPKGLNIPLFIADQLKACLSVEGETDKKRMALLQKAARIEHECYLNSNDDSPRACRLSDFL